MNKYTNNIDPSIAANIKRLEGNLKYYHNQGFEKFEDYFSDEVYSNLPPDLQEICKVFKDKRRKDVCLIGMITALSAAFTRFRFHHGTDGEVREYSPHIFSIVLGTAGSGKSTTRYGMTLVEKISARAIEIHKQSLAKFKTDKREYDSEIRKKDRNSLVILTEPTKPPKIRFAMSASDTTQAALVEILNDNPAGGFAYDSEVDTMVQGNAKKDFGGFSDVLRKVFHHEPLARQRKGDNETYIVKDPRLAVMLSGTQDQLRKLINAEKNGLFSRFWYYSIPKTFIEYDYSSFTADVVGQLCTSLQQNIFDLADLWNDQIINLKFSDSQEMQLYNALMDKEDIEKRYGGDIGASWLRMALITKRIATTLTGLQYRGDNLIPDNCMMAAMAILPSMKQHCITALDIVRMNQGKIQISKEAYTVMKNEGMTDQQIAEEIGCNNKTIQRRKAEWELTGWETGKRSQQMDKGRVSSFKPW